MTISITRDPKDRRFTIIVTDGKDTPKQLVAAVQFRCALNTIKSLFIAPGGSVAAWVQAVWAIKSYFVDDLTVHQLPAHAGGAIIAILGGDKAPSAADAAGELDEFLKLEILKQQSDRASMIYGALSNAIKTQGEALNSVARNM